MEKENGNGRGMLILTRKIGETIWIGQDIEIVVLKPRPGSRDDVALGIIADKEKYPIRRGEHENGENHHGPSES